MPIWMRSQDRLQLHHATTDSTVPVAVSEQLQRQMEAAGRPSELYLYEGDNHNIAVNFYTAMERSLSFFDAHVKGVGGKQRVTCQQP